MTIKPGREKGEPLLPPKGLLLVNPAEAKAGRQLAQSLEAKRHFLFNSSLAVIPAPSPDAGPFFVAGPAVGAPMAVLTLEKLVALGARALIVYGWCGSLNASLRIGDVLLPTWAVSDEGTSAHYPVEGRAESHGPSRTLLAEGLARQGLTVRSGPVWTTDAPYRESKVRVRELGSRNIMGVDMEFGALVTAAAFRQIDLAAVLLVSDELWGPSWNPGFRSKDFRQKSGVILDFLAKFVARQVNAGKPA